MYVHIVAQYRLLEMIVMWNFQATKTNGIFSRIGVKNLELYSHQPKKIMKTKSLEISVCCLQSIRRVNWVSIPATGRYCLATLMSSDRTKQICLWMTIEVYSPTPVGSSSLAKK